MSLRARPTLALLALVLALAPGAAAANGFVSIHEATDLPAEEIAGVEATLRSIAEASAARFGATATNVTFLASPNATRVAEAYFALEGIQVHPQDAAGLYAPWNRSARIVAARDHIVVVANPAWYGLEDGTRTIVLAHEYFHVLQNVRSGPLPPATSRDAVGAAGPLWLREGGGHYAQWKIGEDLGAACVGVEEHRLGAMSASTSVPLSHLHARARFDEAGTDEAHVVAALAVRELAETRGDASLLAFFDELGRGVAWPEAFRAAFGTDASAFEAAFDASRAGWVGPEPPGRGACLGWFVASRIPGPGAAALALAVAGAALVRRRRPRES